MRGFKFGCYFLAGLFTKGTLIFFPFEAFAQDVKPVISIAAPTFDFGSVQEGTKVQHEFSVVNKGTSDLLIQRVIAGCGCTAAAALNQALAANTESKINVTFDTAGMSGAQSKTVRVYTNDPENPISTLTLNGNVDQKIIVEPNNVLFESVTRGQAGSIKKDVKITATPGSGVKIGEIQSFSKFVKVENIAGGESEKSFSVILDNTLPLGDFRERVIVKLSGAGKSNINIPIYANVKGNLQLNPPAVSFGIISGSELVTKKVSLENRSDIAYSLKSVESLDDAVTVKVIENKPGKSYTLEVTLDPKKVESDIRTELKFNAETELEETLVMNAYGVFPPKQ